GILPSHSLILPLRKTAVIPAAATRIPAITSHSRVSAPDSGFPSRAARARQYARSSRYLTASNSGSIGHLPPPSRVLSRPERAVDDGKDQQQPEPGPEPRARDHHGGAARAGGGPVGGQRLGPHRGRAGRERVQDLGSLLAGHLGDVGDVGELADPGLAGQAG